jgi:DNA-binding transcriptional ArsR family regulator
VAAHVIELVFTVPDLARTRFASSPMDHLLFGAIAAGPAHWVGASAARQRWWRQVRSRVPHQAAPFIELVNASNLSMPDFLAADITADHPRFGDELDAIAATTDDQIHRALHIYRDRPVPRIVHQLRDDGRRALRRVTDGAWALHRACLAPEWDNIARRLHADIAHRTHTLAARGPAALLASLHPRLSWHDAGTLRYENPAGFDHLPSFRSILSGHGFDLRPNLFLDDGVAFLRQPGRPAGLFYPSAPAVAPSCPPGRVDGLAAALSPARTRALRAIASGPCTTTELAAALGIAPPSASAHTNTLRAAGFITTTRRGTHVHHALTRLGHDLLTANPQPHPT